MKKENNFPIAKVQPLRVLLSFAWFFYQFQPGVVHKSVAYEKKRVNIFCKSNNCQKEANDYELNDHIFLPMSLYK